MNKLTQIAIVLGTCQMAVLAQNCAADLEWPASTQSSPGTSSNAVVVWPTSLETRSIITDRHPAAAVSQVTPTTFPPSVGGSICDPTFKTFISRVTPEGYSLQSESFSAGGGWVLTIGPGGSLVAFGIDTATGKPKMVNGLQQMVPLTYLMLPRSPTGNLCTLTNVSWSKAEEGVAYLVGCGTRIFKYNLARYDQANPMAGLVAGSGPRSAARWPACSGAGCVQGPVFLDFDDLFGAHSRNGTIGGLTISVSDNDTTFSGFVTRGDGYKNARGVFAYRPWNNSLWYSVSPVQTPEPQFLLKGRLNNIVINKRIVGAQADRQGRYIAIGVCSDAIYSLDGCSTSTSYIFDLNAVTQGSRLIEVNPAGVDRLSHGAMASGLRIGSDGQTQALAVQYFGGVPEKKLLSLPNLVGTNNWWGSYTDTGYVYHSTGAPIASVHSTYSYDQYFGTPAQGSACPGRHCLYGNELILFNSSGTRFLRLAHNQSNITDYSPYAYWDLPRVSFTRDGKYVAFVSNWGTMSNATASRYSVYLVRVPASWRMLLDDTITVNTSVSMLPPGGESILTVSHRQTATGANVLLQDASQSAAVKATACLFQVTKSKMIQLANDSGVFTNAFRGPLGSASAGILENSRCSINIAGSTVDATSNGNIIYRLKITYKTAFLNKVVRAIAQPIGASSWTDGTKVDVRAWAFSFMTPQTGGRADEEADAPTDMFRRSVETLEAGSSLEFPFEDPQPFQLNLTDDHMQIRLAVSKTEEGGSQFEVLEGSERLAVVPEVKVGSLVRVDYRTDGMLSVSVDGAEVATARGPASRAGLYLVTDRVHSQLRRVLPVTGE